MTLQPPATEEELQDNETCSKQEARRVTEMSEESESPVIKKHSPENGLSQIIRKAHFSVWCDLDKPVLC